MLFDSPHSCPECNFNFNSSSPHYHFLLCTFSNSNKYSRLQLINKNISCLYTPPLLQHHILFSLSDLYNVEQSSSKYFISSSKFSSSDIYNCIEFQSRIGWNQFIRGRLTNSFRPSIQHYHAPNKQGKHIKVTSWYRKLTASLFLIHSPSWNDYCSVIYQYLSKEIIPPSKESILKLVTKYYSLYTNLPVTK